MIQVHNAFCIVLTDSCCLSTNSWCLFCGSPCFSGGLRETDLKPLELVWGLLARSPPPDPSSSSGPSSLRRTSSAGPSLPQTAQHFALFPLSCSKISFFSSLSGSSRGIVVAIQGRGPLSADRDSQWSNRSLLSTLYSLLSRE